MSKWPNEPFKLQAMREVFLTALKADRTDQASRNVFADWLDDNGFEDEATFHRGWKVEINGKAEDWLRDFAQKVDLEYEEVIYAGHLGLKGEALNTEINMDPENYFWGEGEDRSIKKFWECWELATGIKAEFQDQDPFDVPFRCSC